MSKRTLVIIAAAVVVLGVVAWLIFGGSKLPRGFAAGNGRLEANQLYIASKYPGRIKEVLVNEGDTVEAGQVVARMDTEELEAQLAQALAQIKQQQDTERLAVADVGTKRAQIENRQADLAAKQAEQTYAQQQYARSKGLVGRGAVSEQEAESDSAQMLMTRANAAAAGAQLASARADLIGAQATVGRTGSTIEAARAEADRIRAQIKESVLVAPTHGRIERRLAETGEVLASGGRVYSMVDLRDVYMYIFLPESVTGKIPLGSEARIVLDAAPQYPIRAFVSYVSPQAQFTPKTVETQEERHNLTFRIKLQIPKERLVQYEALVKSGTPGMGYVRYDNAAQWPEKLQPAAKVPTNLWQPTGGSSGSK
jgi:HlyD family secretion protein